MLAGSQFGIIRIQLQSAFPNKNASQVLELAHRLDSGEEIESDTKSRMTDSDYVIQSNIPKNEIITQSEILNQGLEVDCVIDSKSETQSLTNLETTTSNFLHNEIITKSKSEAIEIAKKILLPDSPLPRSMSACLVH